MGAFADAFWLRQRSIADFDWIDDLRHGWRQLVEHRGCAIVAVGILSIGLAATVAMFSVTDQILLRPLPYPDPDRIVTLWETRADEREVVDVAPGNFLDWGDRTRSFAHLSGVAPWSMEFTGGSRPEVLVAAKATAGVFESFGVMPVAGRFFTPEEYQQGRDKVVVLHEAFWRQRFGGDPAIVGQALQFEDGPHVVVGIVQNSLSPAMRSTRQMFPQWQYAPTGRAIGARIYSRASCWLTVVTVAVVSFGSC